MSAYAYALLSGRIYLLLRPQTQEDISRLLQAHSRLFVPAMNRALGWHGGLWRERFSSALVSPSWSLKVMRFVDLAAVCTGVVGAPGIFRWSSYTQHVGQQSRGFLQTLPAYWALAETPLVCEQAYEAWCAQAVSRVDLRAIEHAAVHSGVLGSDDYLDEVASRLGYSVRPAPLECPRKQTDS